MHTSDSVATNPHNQTTVPTNSFWSPNVQRNRKRFAPRPEFSSQEREQIAFQVLTDEFYSEDGGTRGPRRGDVVIFQLGAELRDADRALVTTQEGDLMMVVCKSEIDGVGFEFSDLLSGEIIPVAQKDIFGRLEETHYRQGNNFEIGWRPVGVVPWGQTAAEQIGVALVITEEAFEDGEHLINTMAAFSEVALFEKLREQFQRCYDPSADDTTPNPFTSPEEARDYAVRFLCAQMFRAGQLAERQTAIDSLR
jgi:hypothetical protein